MKMTNQTQGLNVAQKDLDLLTSTRLKLIKILPAIAKMPLIKDLEKFRKEFKIDNNNILLHSNRINQDILTLNKQELPKLAMVNLLSLASKISL